MLTVLAIAVIVLDVASYAVRWALIWARHRTARVNIRMYDDALRIEDRDGKEITVSTWN